MNEAATEKRPMAILAGRRFAFPTRTAFLSQAALLEEVGPPRAPALVCLLGFTFVTAAILAGMLIEMDVVATSTGRIVAAEGNHVLQSFNGGIVDRVQAEEGQVVEAGDLLLTLDDPEGEAQLDRLIVREAALSAQIDRLRTLANLTAVTSLPRSEDAAAVANEQMSILPLGQDALTAERALVQAEIDRRLQTIANSRDLSNDAKSRLSIVEGELRTARGLHAKGLLPNAKLLEAERQAIDAAYDLKEIQGQIREADASLAESYRRLDNVVAGTKQRQADQLSTILIDLNDTRQQIEATHRRLERSRVRAATSGVVLELKVRHPGQTVAPGDPVAEIVPTDGGLVAEIRVPTSEVSYVHPGQPVRIAIDGIEPHRHGYLKGKVDSISPSTFIDENALPYYRGSIYLATDHLDTMALTPGMTVQAQIITGQRTILEYLLKPVYRAWNTAFRER